MVNYAINGELYSFEQALSPTQLLAFQAGNTQGGTLVGPANITQPPNWFGLEQGFWDNISDFSYILGSPAQALLFQVVNNGKNRESVEDAILFALNSLGITFTTQQKADLNALLANNHFTVSLA